MWPVGFGIVVVIGIRVGIVGLDYYRFIIHVEIVWHVYGIYGVLTRINPLVGLLDLFSVLLSLGFGLLSVDLRHSCDILSKYML